MKREARLLLEKACDSLLLSIELFNRPNDRGRVSGALIQLDHAFEMLLKTAIIHRGGRIREKRAKETIGFDACVRRALSDGRIKFLADEQALTLQMINGLRDAAQHHLLDISEGQLYLHEQAGVTLFRELLKGVFGRDLTSHLPTRVLPVSTSLPTDLATLFDSEISEIQKLLRPGRRRGIEAEARLRPLAILDAALKGEKGQPSSTDLQGIGKELRSGKKWPEVFKGAAAVQITTDGSGPTLSLRLSKKEGIPIQLVPEGTPGAAVVAVKRVNELDFYSLGAKQLAKKVNLTMPRAIAVVDYLGLRKESECYREFKIGKQIYKRYSLKAVEKINSALQQEPADAIWAKRHLKKLTP
ncbi:MAG TPA: DUF3644 domain-containing protein [Methylocella sp.]|nr:DUF3644 domain-containing protein [Methylocella sp.]